MLRFAVAMIAVTALVASVYATDDAIAALKFNTKTDAHQHCLAKATGTNALSVTQCTNGEKQLGQIKGGKKIVAMCYHSFSTTSMGWDIIEIRPLLPKNSPSRSELRDAYYYAGVLEGYATYQNLTQIKMPGIAARQWDNVSTFISEHIQYQNSSSQASAAKDPFWARVGMMLQQVQGMADGFNIAAAAMSDAARATFTDAYLAAMYFELNFDIRPKFAWTKPAAASTTTTTTTTSAAAAAADASPPKEQSDNDDIAAADEVGDPGNSDVPVPLPYRPTHCSALVKITSDNLFMAHTSWFDFATSVAESKAGVKDYSGSGPSMGHRLFKTYHFDTTVRMSSYVGFLFSGDDWYVTSKKLAVFETSLSNFRFKQLKDKIIPKAVATFIRVMVANYLSANAKDWAATFARENMGTYNNQYGAVNAGAFKPGQPLPDDLMWIGEQLPGQVATLDVTPVLRAQGYFPSFNVAYINSIWTNAGYDVNYKKYGSFFSFNDTTRAQIFRRNQTDVKATRDMQNLIRYNGYLINDPLCKIPNCEGTKPVNNKCHPDSTPRLAIANRGDRAPKREGNSNETMGPLWQYWIRGANGAYDGKVFSWKDLDTLQAHIISGPTQSNGLPPFTFTENRELFPEGAVLPPPGMPDTYNFGWVSTIPASAVKSESSAGFWSDKQSVGAVVGGVLGLIGLVLVIVWVKRQQPPPRPAVPLAQQAAARDQVQGGDAYQAADGMNQ